VYQAIAVLDLQQKIASDKLRAAASTSPWLDPVGKPITKLY
jgi:hypothetical protein